MQNGYKVFYIQVLQYIIHQITNNIKIEKSTYTYV